MFVSAHAGKMLYLSEHKILCFIYFFLFIFVLVDLRLLIVHWV